MEVSGPRREDGRMTTPADGDAALITSWQADDHAIDAIYDAPYIIFVYTAWAAASWLFGDTAGLSVLIGGTAVLTAAGLGQRADAFHPHSFAADLATILLYCSAAIGAAWFVVQGLTTQPTVTLLGLGATLAAVVAIAMADPDD